MKGLKPIDPAVLKSTPEDVRMPEGRFFFLFTALVFDPPKGSPDDIEFMAHNSIQLLRVSFYSATLPFQGEARSFPIKGPQN